MLREELGSGMARGALVGRDAAVDTILETLRAGRVPIVRGAGGIGKTAVLQCVTENIGTPTLMVAGVDFLGHQRLLPFERAAGRSLIGDVEAVASDVRSAVGEDGLVVVDNLQWADRDSIALLPALAARGPLALAIRSPELDPACLDCLDGIEPVDVALGPLAAADAAELLARLGPGLPSRSAEQTLRLAAGNPLLLGLLVRSHGVLDHHGEDLVESLLMALPLESIDRLARLSVGLPVRAVDPGADLLVAAGMVATSGDGFCLLRAELLASAAVRKLSDGVRRALHLEAAAQAEAAGAFAVAAEHLMRADEPDAAYALARTAIAAAEPDPPSALLLLALEVAPDADRWELIELSVHQLLLEGDVERAGEVASAERPRGGEDSRYDTLEAYVFLQRNDGAAAEECLDRALESAPEDMRAAKLALRAGARASLFDVAGAREDALQALALGPDGDSGPVARFVLAGSALLSGDESWRSELRLALDEARAVRSRPLEVRSGITLAYGLFLSGDREEAVEVCRELVAAAAERRDELSECAIAKLLVAHLVFCDLAPRELLVELDGLLRHPATRDDLTGGWSVAAIGWADRGEFDRAEDAAAHAQAEATRAGANGEVASAWASAEMAWLRGSPAWSEEHARRGLAQAMIINPAHANCASLVAWSQLELGRPVEVPIPYVPFAAASGLVVEISGVQALAAGDHERAIDLFTEAQRRHDRYFRRSALRSQWGIAEAQRRAGDLEGALVTLKQLHETSSRAGVSIGPRLAESIVRCDPSGRRPRAAARPPVTARQREVLSLVHGGLRTPEIAGRLGLSPATVDTHIRSAMDRLGVSSRAEAARRVMEPGEPVPGMGE
jgi:DNA-binding CsgD family transcriptional regulator/tetratricopeptide (TPR) repeat protein